MEKYSEPKAKFFWSKTKRNIKISKFKMLQKKFYEEINIENAGAMVKSTAINKENAGISVKTKFFWQILAPWKIRSKRKEESRKKKIYDKAQRRYEDVLK